MWLGVVCIPSAMYEEAAERTGLTYEFVAYSAGSIEGFMATALATQKHPTAYCPYAQESVKEDSRAVAVHGALTHDIFKRYITDATDRIALPVIAILLAIRRKEEIN